MFRREKDTKLDNEGLRRMREAIRQRIDQEELDGSKEQPEAEAAYPTQPAETFTPPSTSYEPVGHEGQARSTNFSFLEPSHQDRPLPTAAATEFTPDVQWEPVTEQAAAPKVTTVAAGTVWRGTLQSTDSIQIEGGFEGEIITAKELFIAEGAKVEATVRATTIIVRGQLNGQINCQERLEIFPSGRVSGQLDAGRFIVHEGAFLGGQVRMQSASSATTTTEDGRPVLQRVR